MRTPATPRTTTGLTGRNNRPGPKWRIESASKEPCWRAVYVVGPVWCDKCGRSIKNHCVWERDIPHKRAGKFRCVECMPEKIDYR